jgi:hypothetical protein
LGWQLVDTYRASVALSNEIIELDTEVASLEIQIAEVEGDRIELYDHAVELEARQVEIYYQGVWSLCMVFNSYIIQGGGTDLVDCETMVSSGYEMKWHERDAPGFEWPPSSD